jgi:hypothetical protein
MFAADGLTRQGNPDDAVSSDGETGASADGGTTAPDAGTGDGVSSEPGAPGTIEPAPANPDGEPTILPEPLPGPEELPEPETVTVTLDRADATLLLVWDVDGNAWLVPGYAYEQPEQGFWTAVISLVEGVIQLPEPMTAEILPAEEAQ